MRATGSTAQGIKASKLPQLFVVLPPIQEQRQIVAQVDLECAPLDRLTSRLQREIELLREFHASLIAEVVTGKRDVRRASEAISRVDLPEAETDLDHDPDATELTDEETEA